jgi:RNA polymerase sigma-70 factor (ECF subfamily)
VSAEHDQPPMTHRDITLDQAATTTAETDVTFRMDEDAFRGFYDRTARMLWSYLYRLTRDRQAADDLLQETYYRFLRADAPLGSDVHRRRYLFRIATNLARDGHRRRLARPPHVSHDDVEPIAAGETSETFQQRVDLSRALSRVGVRERALLWLAYAQGASHEEIAVIVGVKLGSVKALLYRARRRVAALLGARS